MGIPQPAEITAVVLAGGRGTRMGGQDKGLLPLHGRPMIAHVIERLRPQVGSLVISANRNLDRYAAFGYPVVKDTIPDGPGPLAGLLAGFVESGTEWVMTVPCDTPLLPADLVRRLARAVAQSGARLATVRAGERTHAAFMLAHRALAADLEAFLAAGERRVQSWQERQNRVVETFADATAFANVNTPGELQRLENHRRDAE